VTWLSSTVGRATRRSAALAASAVLLAAGAAAAGAAVPPPPPQPPTRVLVAEAFEAIDADAFARARTIAAQLEDPLLRKALQWFVLVEQRSGGDFAAYRRFLRENPDWPWQYTLQYRAEGVMPAELPDAEVRAFFENRRPVSAYGAERYADALISADLKEAARALLRHTWLEGDFPAGDEQRFYGRYGHLLGEDLHRQRLDRLIWERELDAAERQMHRVDPAHRALARARIRLARMQPGVDGAIAAVPESLRDHPGLVFERARWRQRMGRFEDAVALLDPPRPSAPYAAAWWPLRHWAAREALDRGSISLAYRLAANHGLESGLGFAQGEWLAGWIALRFLDEPAWAYRHFTRLFEGVSTPVSRARGAYWAARAAESATTGTKARRWYETAATNLTTFYGQLAAARLSEDIFLALPRAPRPEPAERARFEERELVRVVRRLSALGQEDRIGRFIRFLAKDMDDGVAAKLVADLAAEAGRRDLTVRVARKARRQGIILPDHLYPVIALPETRATGGENRDALLLAIIRQESSFRVGAVSHAGAYGLMQLMPATARQAAAELNVAFDRRRLRLDGDYSIRLGSHYLAELIDRFDGSLLLAVAAYNAGPARVTQWLKRYGDPRKGFIGPIDWIESLPFSETRNYVQRVFESLTIYRHRVAPTQVALALDGDLLLQPHQASQLGSPAVSCCL